MMKKTFLLVFQSAIIVAILLSACQPDSGIQILEITKEVVKTVEVEKPVEQTRIVEVSRPSFSTPNPILQDIRVRQAMAYCTNKVELARAGYPLLSEEEAGKLVMDTMIPKAHWAYAGDENITMYNFDPEKGKALLEEAGWKLFEGSNVRQKDDGSVLALKFTTTTASFRQAWAEVWEIQMSDCGIQILRSHVPSSWFYGQTTGLAVRDFELGAYAWITQANPGGDTLWTCDQIPTVENLWQGNNVMGWCNETATSATHAAVRSLVREERIKDYTVLQQQYTRDVPALPLFNRTETFATVAALQVFEPKPGEKLYTYNAADWVIPGRDTIVLAFTQDPASLYTTIETDFPSVLARSLISFPRAHTTLNYTYEPLYLTELPTIESGLALNNDIEVKEGEKVQDATGEVVELRPGVKLLDAAGAEVAFGGAPVTMKQLVVIYDFIDGITWQDGQRISKADFELSYRAGCDQENGAAAFPICDRIQKVTFDDDSKYTVTYLPGYQDPEYFSAPFLGAPAHQPIETVGPYKGKTLADVPARDWPSLKEVVEAPWGYGPYMLKDWVRGERLVFEANPYYFKGEAKTKHLVILIVAPESAEERLLGGQVDILGSETLPGLTEGLVNAQTAGRIKNYIEASPTWEHIDFNLFLR